VQIRYRIADGPVHVRLAIYDVRGQRIKLLDSSSREAGEYARTWDRRTESGEMVARGIYVVGLDAGATRSTRKLLLLGR
jgi:hypothetical protein